MRVCDTHENARRMHRVCAQTKCVRQVNVCTHPAYTLWQETLKTLSRTVLAREKSIHHLQTILTKKSLMRRVGSMSGTESVDLINSCPS